MYVYHKPYENRVRKKQLKLHWFPIDFLNHAVQMAQNGKAVDNTHLLALCNKIYENPTTP